MGSDNPIDLAINKAYSAAETAVDDLVGVVQELRKENQQLESKLAVAVEALEAIEGKNQRQGMMLAGDIILTCRRALTAITSDAPAKADSGLGVMCACGHTFGKHVGEEHCTYCSCTNFIAAAGTASKPGLVVGQRYKLGELPVGARFEELGDVGIVEAHTPDNLTRSSVMADGRPGYGCWHQSTFVTLVSLPLPSAKADEGKAQFKKCSACDGTKIVPGANEYTTEVCRECFDGMVPAQPAPPALTRDSTPSDWRGLKIHVFNGRLVLEDDKYVIAAVDCADIVRAALSDGGAK